LEILYAYRREKTGGEKKLQNRLEEGGGKRLMEKMKNRGRVARGRDRIQKRGKKEKRYRSITVDSRGKNRGPVRRFGQSKKVQGGARAGLH